MLRWITSGLGFFFGGGFIGGVIGYAAGSLLEKLIHKEYQGVPRLQGDFSISLLILAAAIMKTDGKIMKSELNFVKDFFTRQFGEAHTKNRLEILKELLNKDINIEEACEKIRGSLTYASRLQLLHYLFGVAVADNACTEVEKDLIHRISQLLWLQDVDYKTIEAMYFENIDSAYTILQIERTSTDEQIKKAYRKMAIKYHPDKVEALGDDAKKAAKEKFQIVNNAYDKIKKERNII